MDYYIIILNMSFPRNQQNLGLEKPSFRNYQMRSLQRMINCQSNQDIILKIKSSICFILQACDQQNLQKSTKYMALSIFYRYINSHLSFSDNQLGILIFCCLDLSAKFNEVADRNTVFDSPSYYEALNIVSSKTQINEFQIQLYRYLGFKIFTKSPYDYLDELQKERDFPPDIIQALNGFIDFSLTLIQMVKYNAEEILIGCLLALKLTKDMQDQLLIGIIQELCSRSENVYQIGQIIMLNWKQILLEEEL